MNMPTLQTVTDALSKTPRLTYKGIMTFSCPKTCL